MVKIDSLQIPRQSVSPLSDLQGCISADKVWVYDLGKSVGDKSMLLHPAPLSPAQLRHFRHEQERWQYRYNSQYDLGYLRLVPVALILLSGHFGN